MWVSELEALSVLVCSLLDLSDVLVASSSLMGLEVSSELRGTLVLDVLDSTLYELLDSAELELASTELSEKELSSGFSFEHPAKSQTQEIAAHKICFFIFSPSNKFTLLYHFFITMSRLSANYHIKTHNVFVTLKNG